MPVANTRVLPASIRHDAAADPPGASGSPRLISDALVNYSGLAVASVVGILLVPFMLAHLGTERYGVWLSAIALSATLRTIDFGLGMVVVREVAAATGTRLHRRAAPLVSAAGGAHLLLGAAGALLLAGGALALTGPLRLSDDTRGMVLPVFALVGVAFAGDQAIGFVSSVLTGLRRFATLNLIAVVLVTLRAAGTVALLLLGHSLVAVAAWHAAATVLSAGLALLVLRAAPGRYGVGIPGRHWRSLRRHLGFGIASFATASAAGLSWQALPLLTAVLLGAGAVVPLHLGQKIPLALTSIYARLSSVVFPAASEYERTDNVRGTQAVLETGSRLVVHLMMPVLIVGLLAAPELLRVWVGPPAPEVVLVFRLTLVAVLADALGSVASGVLWGRGEVGPVLATGIATAAIVLGGGALVLPRFGTPGAAAVLALVLGVAAVAFWVMASRAARVRPGAFARGTARGIALPTLACAGAAIACLSVPAIPGLPRLALAAAAGGGAYLWSLARFGANADERAFAARAARLPREVALPAGRALGARIPALRSLGYLLLWSRYAFARNGGPRAEFDGVFAAVADPWGYESDAQRERIDAALREVDALRAGLPGGRFGEVLEIGCAEGAVTEHLAHRAERVVAADVSALALARCGARCSAFPHVELLQTDFTADALDESFALVTAMDVLECLRSPRLLHTARERLVQLLRPGGWLLVSTTRQHPVAEGAWWGRWLPVGARINEFVGRHPAFRIVHSTATRTHAVTVYRRIG